MLEKLREKNPNIRFYEIGDECPLFRRVSGIDTDEIVKLGEELSVPTGNSYVASDERLERLSAIARLSRVVFGEMSVQAGWNYGTNKKMNGLEWHKSSETVVACTDEVLLLGDFRDVTNDEYESNKAVALYLKKGEAAELLPLTLHFAPLPVGATDVSAIILPRGTNLPLAEGIDGTLRAKNKWLLLHAENEKGIALGGKVGIVGENIEIKI